MKPWTCANREMSVNENFLLHLFCLVWLVACAWQDWRKREVSNWLTLPPFGLAAILRQAGFTHTPFLLALTAVALVLVIWRVSWIGGADAKGALALALLDMQFFAWAWLGLGLWYLGLRLVYGRKCDRRLPAFVGFAAGAGALLAVQVLQ